VENWNRGTLVLDQQAIDRLGLTPVPQDPTPVPSLGEIVATLQTGSPVIIEGPGPGWCVQAVAEMDEQLVNIEVLDPEHWETGPPLPAKQQKLMESLGLQREAGAWSRLEHDEDGISGLRRAAELMLTVADQAWGMPPQGALRLDDVPPPDAPWEQIAEFAHTFNGYAHLGEAWGEKFNAVRERYFETEELPDDVDELRACLFCEFRMDRFSWGDDVSLSEADAEGVRHIINNPDFESTPTQRYRRAVLDRLRELLARQ